MDVAKPSFPKLSPKRPRASSDPSARGDAPLGDAGAEADRDAGAGAQNAKLSLSRAVFASASRRSSWRASTTRGVGGLRLGESSLSDSSDAVKDVGCVGDARAARFSPSASGTLGRRASSGTAARFGSTAANATGGRPDQNAVSARLCTLPNATAAGSRPSSASSDRSIPRAVEMDASCRLRMSPTKPRTARAKRARGGDRGDDASATRGAGRRASNVSAVSRASRVSRASASLAVRSGRA